MTECPLTHREMEIVTALSEGFVPKEIATRLQTTDHAITSALRMARARTATKNTTGLVAMALRKGWIS